MPGKKRFGSKADEAINQQKAGIANSAKRRLGAQAAGARFGPGTAKKGAVSGPGLGGVASLAADRVKRFQPLGGGTTVPVTGGTNTPGGPSVPGPLDALKKGKPVNPMGR